jgi:transcriptional regulator with XRE-family HTH domain
MFKKEKLEELKKRFNLKSNKELAAYAGISYNTLNTWIQRDSIPIEFMVKIAQVSHIAVDDLINNEIVVDEKKEKILDKIKEIEEKFEELKKLL